MGNKMLIDAAHPEETRVVVLRGNRIEEFDFEAASKRQLRGNIYLAKVTRVEPSLQAAFIEYGGNRHGFLAFSEIHPDYYQIPVADRQQLLEDEARSAEEDEEEPRGGSGGQSSNGGHRRSRRHRRGGGRESAERRAPNNDEQITAEADAPFAGDAPEPVAGAERSFADQGEVVGDEVVGDEVVGDEVVGNEEVADGDLLTGEGTDLLADIGAADDQPAWEAPAGQPEPDLLESADALPLDAVAPGPEGEGSALEDEGASDEGEASLLELREFQPLPDLPDPEPQDVEPHDAEGHEEEVVEQLGGDALEDVPHRFSRPRRNYKIQEVIKRRQVLLVQVVKEERGNKGAALTTYLSLAGRYSVLMPNTARGGGISRKIVDPEDRKRLKAIAQELEVPDGMGIILRTAGASRSMPEVRRDFEYLMRMWETVRETTLKSTAPTLVYEEGSLIKRSIRDLFTKDVDEVVVAGDDAYREAKEFMRLLMPNQVRSVVPWRESQPLFAKSGAEAQLDAMFSSQVVLKSGGYLVINQTEALVAIDVNSGRSTREHNIEDTAVRTNLEAADEIARQLRLRDLAGLIVVDFIDMEEGRNDRAVERRLKDALKNDRARIQIGRISHFGLLEMSRQRMRTGVLEGSTVMCPHCAGSGTVRSVSSIALHVLRLLEDTLIRSAAHNLVARTRAEVALYVLNQKRANLLDLEARFGVAITVIADPAMTGMVYHAVERGTEATPPQFLPFLRADKPVPETELDEIDEEMEDGPGEVADELPEGVAGATSGLEERSRDEAARQAIGEEGGRRRRRRRRRRGKDGQHEGSREGGAPETEPLEGAEDGLTDEEVAGEGEDLTDLEAGFLPEDSAPEAVDVPEPMAAEPVLEAPPAEEDAPVPADEPGPLPLDEIVPEAGVEAPRRRRTSRRTVRSTAEAAPAEAAASEAEASVEEAAAPPRRARRPRNKVAAEPAPETVAEAPQASADRDIEADTAQQHAAQDTSPEPEPELPLAAAEPVATAAAEPAAPASATPEPAPEPDPDRPKRSGWWQRAKATFTAGS